MLEYSWTHEANYKYDRISKMGDMPSLCIKNLLTLRDVIP